MNFVRHISSFIFLVLSSFHSYGQNEMEFLKLDSEDGSTQSISYSIDQDSSGNIWIGTEEGVTKYNSNKFYNYDKYNGLPEEIGNRIPVVFIDSRDQIWLGTEKGVCKFNAGLDKFDLVIGQFGYTPTLVKSIAEDHENRIWIGGYNGLWSITEEGKIVQKLANYNIQSILVASEKFIIGTSTSILIYDPSNGDLVERSDLREVRNTTFVYQSQDFYLIGTKANGLYKSNLDFTSLEKVELEGMQFPITDIIKQENGNFLVASDGGGIYILNSQLQLIHNYRHNEDDDNSISSDGVYDVHSGKEGIIWIASYGGGVNFIDPAKLGFKKIRHSLNNANSLENNFTRSIEEDKDGNIWFGTKEGISIWNRDTDQWSNLNSISNIVLALEESGNYMWAGTYARGAFKINLDDFSTKNFSSSSENPISIDKIYTLCRDSQGSIWIGGIDGNLTRISSGDDVKTFNLPQIRSIIQLSNGNILAGGRNGAFLINASTGESKVIEKLDPKSGGLEYLNINAIEETPDGRVIFATNGAGLVVYNFATTEITTLDVSKGMPTDIIQGVIVINDQEFWASTTKGLTRILLRNDLPEITVYDEQDGLASTEFNFGSYEKLADGTLLFGGVDGVTLFDPSKLSNASYRPVVNFEFFSLFNERVKPGSENLPQHINTLSELNLSHKQNSITIGFAGITQSSPSKVKYSWKLEGFDDEWTQPRSIDQVNYTNINPGNYVFRVKAANRAGDFGDEKSLQINIGKPWWATNLAYFIYILFGIALVFLIIYITRFVINRRNAEEQIDFFNNITHEIKTPLTILLSSLERISNDKSTSENNSNQKIKTTISRLNSLFEQMLNFQKVTLDENPFDIVSKIDLGSYIDKIVKNFEPMLEERGLQVKIHNEWKNEVFYYDKENLNKIIFNLLSNAIKYSNEDGKITINLLKPNSKNLKLEVVDEGMGIPLDQQKHILKKYYRARNVINSQRPGTGLGLMMVKTLVEKSGGKIEFVSEENVGTTFSVELVNKEYLYKQSAVKFNAEQVELQIAEQAEIHEFSDAKVLIVEDNDELRELLSETLGTYFQVFTAINGREGVEKASEFFPDIILTDLIMPEMDGMEMCRVIKDDINLNHIPIFMFTVLRNSVQKIKSLESGVTEYLEKPINMNVLLAKIINMLGYQRKLRKRYVHLSEVEEAVEYRTQQDKDFVDELEKFILEKIKDEALSVHDLCQFVGMSRTSLYMKLKNLVDLSPQDFIIHTKLRNAKALLLKGDANIKEISYQSGFSNPKYFSTSFKKFYGVSPSKYLDSIEK